MESCLLHKAFPAPEKIPKAALDVLEKPAEKKAGGNVHEKPNDKPDVTRNNPGKDHEIQETIDGYEVEPLDQADMIEEFYPLRPKRRMAAMDSREAASKRFVGVLCHCHPHYYRNPSAAIPSRRKIFCNDTRSSPDTRAASEILPRVSFKRRST